MEEVVIVAAVRTPIGSFGGSLSSISAVTLGATVIREALVQAGVDPGEVDEVIMGNVLQSGLGQNPARQAAHLAGLPASVPAFTVNKVCGSGLKAITLAAQAIAAGESETIVAGGMENMSRAPYLLEGARWGYRMNDGGLVDSMIRDGLACAFGNYHMGITAENVAAKYGISRQEQDALALKSQSRACRAIKDGRFNDEIIPIEIKGRKGEVTSFRVDEFPRLNANAEALAKLEPAFQVGGSVTAGNSSGINDGAVALVVMSAREAARRQIRTLAVIRASAVAGVEPALMGTGPIPASRKALIKANIKVADLGLVEANEAFAAQAIAVCRDLGFDPEKTNVNGGAVALGHPIGASGARILVTLIYEMNKRRESFGLATLCIGGGQGIAMVVERT